MKHATISYGKNRKKMLPQVLTMNLALNASIRTYSSCICNSFIRRFLSPTHTFTRYSYILFSLIFPTMQQRRRNVSLQGCALVSISITCNSFDGVFATSQAYLDNAAVFLSPATSLMGIASQISFKSSCVSFTAKDPMLLSRFVTLIVPVNHPINKFHIMLY